MAVGKEKNIQGREAKGVSTKQEGVKTERVVGRYAVEGGKQKRLKAQAGNK